MAEAPRWRNWEVAHPAEGKRTTTTEAQEHHAGVAPSGLTCRHGLPSASVAAGCARPFTAAKATMKIWEDTDRLSNWFDACEPERVPKEDEYVDFDRWVDGDAPEGSMVGLRGTPFVVRAVSVMKLRRSHGQSCQLMTGFRGSGKTTELSRLASALRANGFAVVQADVRQFDNLTRGHTIEDFTLVLAAAIGTAEKSNKLFSENNVFSRISTLLSRVTPKKTTLKFGAANIEFDLKSPDFRDHIRATFTNQRIELKEWFHKLVAEIQHSYHPLPVAILIDGLEKYDIADPKEAEQAYREAASVYEDFADWLRLPGVHVVYCVPPLFATMEQAFRARYDDIHPPLASVRIRRRPPSAAECEAGFAALTEAMRKRVDMAALFGENADACARELVRQSGGHIRDLFYLLRAVIRDTMAQQRMLTALDIQRISSRQHGAFGLPSEQVKLLRHVSKTGTVNLDDFGTVVRVLDEYLVLAYANGMQWFGLSPRGTKLLAASGTAEDMPTDPG